MLNNKNKYEFGDLDLDPISNMEEGYFDTSRNYVDFEDRSDFDDTVDDIDFSDLAGKDFKRTLSKVNKKVASRKPIAKKQRKPKKPLSKRFSVETKATIKGGVKKLAKVLVPTDREVIVQGVSKFILSQKPADNSLRNIGYYNGKKLEEMVLIFNNDSAVDFVFSLFNPSMPLDYLYSTSQNLNNKITVAGGDVAYTDLLFNILANPVAIRNATFIINGAQITKQLNVSLQIQDKYVNGVVDVAPINLGLQIDVMQVEGNNVSFNVHDVLGRAYIPDGMDVINYKVLAGSQVTMCFYYEQKSIKKLFFQDSREKRKRIKDI